MVMLAEFESRRSVMVSEGSEELRCWEQEVERLKWLGEESNFPVPPFIDSRRQNVFVTSLHRLEETLLQPGTHSHMHATQIWLQLIHAECVFIALHTRADGEAVQRDRDGLPHGASGQVRSVAVQGSLL
jgi:hypothetical protein